MIYLLDLFSNAPHPGVREKTAELLAKMLSDKLVGPKVRIVLSKFLPPIFMDAMRDSPEASVHQSESKIWLCFAYWFCRIPPSTLELSPPI
jgi:DnaJ family protein C protein 13